MWKYRWVGGAVSKKKEEGRGGRGGENRDDNIKVKMGKEEMREILKKKREEMREGLRGVKKEIRDVAEGQKKMVRKEVERIREKKK